MLVVNACSMRTSSSAWAGIGIVADVVGFVSFRYWTDPMAISDAMSLYDDMTTLDDSKELAIAVTIHR